MNRALLGKIGKSIPHIEIFTLQLKQTLSASKFKKRLNISGFFFGKIHTSKVVLYYFTYTQRINVCAKTGKNLREKKRKDVFLALL